MQHSKNLLQQEDTTCHQNSFDAKQEAECPKDSLLTSCKDANQ